MSCWLNAYLRGGGHFSLHPQGGAATLRPSLTYGVVQLQVNPKAAADLSKVVINKRDTAGFLKIGTNSYPGFTDYTAIPGAHMHAHTQPTTCSGSVVHRSELGAAPEYLFARTARFTGLPVRIHGSRARMLATTGWGHQTCRKTCQMYPDPKSERIVRLWSSQRP